MGYVYLILFVAAAVLAIGLIVGVAFKIAGFVLAALLIVIGASWLMSKMRSARSR